MAPARVLSELRALGFAATERGPEGFLPGDTASLRATLDRHGLRLVASFVPAVLHSTAVRDHELRGVEQAARLLAEAGGEVLVLAAASGEAGYERGGRLSEDEWRSLLSGLHACGEIAVRSGLALALHPHYGTVIEGDEQVARLLDQSEVALCLDVGHLAVAGADALEVAARADGRVRHVHLKDVDAAVASRVRTGELGYHAGVAAGLYRPLGDGAARIAEVVELLESRGYTGYYVLEQDAVLSEDPPPGGGPQRDVERSLSFLRSIL
jgi:inosose dehydratase